MNEPVAIVTGSNKGIGFETVKALCRKFDGIVYLTARNEDTGLKSVKELNSVGLYPKFHQLDISDGESVKKFGEHIKKEHGRIDVLVNNAAILIWDEIYPSYDAAKRTIDTNYKGLLNVEEYLYPLLKNGAKVITVASGAAPLCNLKNRKWADILKDKNLTVDKINEFVNEYLDSVKDGAFNMDDFADEGKHAELRVSKIAASALTMIQSLKYKSKNICINLVHPGAVKTDMSNGRGELEPEDGTKGILYLIFNASPNLSGTFMWDDGKIIDWYNESGEEYCLSGLW